MRFSRSWLSTLMTRSVRNATHSRRLDRDPKQFGAKRVLARALTWCAGDAPTKAIATAREIMREDATRGAFELAEVLVALDRNEEAHQELERLRIDECIVFGEIDRASGATPAYNAGDLKEAQQRRFADLATQGEACRCRVVVSRRYRAA